MAVLNAQYLDAGVVKRLHEKLQRPDGSIPRGSISTFVGRALNRALADMEQKHLKLCSKCFQANRELMSSESRHVSAALPVEAETVISPFAHLLEEMDRCK